MTALLPALLARGFTVRAAAGLLLVRPANRLTPEDRAAIAAGKPALLAALEERRRLEADAQAWADAIVNELADGASWLERENWDGRTVLPVIPVAVERVELFEGG